MKKTSPTSTRQYGKQMEQISEAVIATEKDLVAAISSDLLVPEEIEGIKASIKELQTGSFRFMSLPCFAAELAVPVWYCKQKEHAHGGHPHPGSLDAIPAQKELEKILSQRQAEYDTIYEPTAPSTDKASAQTVKELDLLYRDLDRKADFERGKKRSWYIGMSDSFSKSIERMDKKLKGRVLEAINKIIKDPLKSLGDTLRPLTNDKKGFWRYRMGDYRLIYKAEKETNRIFLLTCGARGDIYG